MLIKKISIILLFIIGPLLMIMPVFISVENERTLRIIGGIIFVGTSLYAYHRSDYPHKKESGDDTSI